MKANFIINDIEYIEFPFIQDIKPIFHEFVKIDGSILLDSCIDQNCNGRYDIFSAHPYKIIEAIDDKTIIYTENGAKTYLNKNPLSLLQTEIQRENCRSLSFNLKDIQNKADYLTPGILGLYGYELQHHLFTLRGIQQKINDIECPKLYLGFYDWLFVSDHIKKKVIYVLITLLFVVKIILQIF